MRRKEIEKYSEVVNTRTISIDKRKLEKTK